MIIDRIAKKEAVIALALEKASGWITQHHNWAKHRKYRNEQQQQELYENKMWSNVLRYDEIVLQAASNKQQNNNNINQNTRIQYTIQQSHISRHRLQCCIVGHTQWWWSGRENRRHYHHRHNCCRRCSMGVL